MIVIAVEAMMGDQIRKVEGSTVRFTWNLGRYRMVEPPSAKLIVVRSEMMTLPSAISECIHPRCIVPTGR
jgi:hypothetical protein